MVPLATVAGDHHNYYTVAMLEDFHAIESGAE